MQIPTNTSHNIWYTYTSAQTPHTSTNGNHSEQTKSGTTAIMKNTSSDDNHNSSNGVCMHGDAESLEILKTITSFGNVNIESDTMDND